MHISITSSNYDDYFVNYYA